MESVKVGNLGIVFEVGQTYSHPKWGEYKVLSFKGDKMKVMFADGEKELTIKLAAQFVFNMKCETAKALQNKSITMTGKNEDVAYTIGRLAVLGVIYSSGMCDNKFDAFKSRYEKSNDTIDEIKNISILQNDANKWGTELSIRLPKNFAQNKRFSLPDNNVNVITNKNDSVINNNSFWWHLVENLGFKLGDKQNIEKIASRFPKQLAKHFMDGVCGVE